MTRSRRKKAIERPTFGTPPGNRVADKMADVTDVAARTAAVSVVTSVSTIACHPTVKEFVGKVSPRWFREVEL